MAVFCTVRTRCAFGSGCNNIDIDWMAKTRKADETYRSMLFPRISASSLFGLLTGQLSPDRLLPQCFLLHGFQPFPFQRFSHASVGIRPLFPRSIAMILFVIVAEGFMWKVLSAA